MQFHYPSTICCKNIQKPITVPGRLAVAELEDPTPASPAVVTPKPKVPVVPLVSPAPIQCPVSWLGFCVPLHGLLASAFHSAQADLARKQQQLAMLLELEKQLKTLHELEELAKRVPQPEISPGVQGL